MKPADQLRGELRQVAKARKAHAEQGAELDRQLGALLVEAQGHPELEMAEAAKLGGLERRATAYAIAKRAKG